MFLTSILGQCVHGYSGQSIRNLLVIISVGWRLWLVSDVFDHLVEFSLGLVTSFKQKEVRFLSLECLSVCIFLVFLHCFCVAE